MIIAHVLEYAIQATWETREVAQIEKHPDATDPVGGACAPTIWLFRFLLAFEGKIINLNALKKIANGILIQLFGFALPFPAMVSFRFQHCGAAKTQKPWTARRTVMF